MLLTNNAPLPYCMLGELRTAFSATKLSILSYLINAQPRLLILNTLPPCLIEFHPTRLLSFGFLLSLLFYLIYVLLILHNYISIKICISC